MNSRGYGLHDFSYGNLVDYLTHVMFWGTGNHELYGAVGEYFTSPKGLGVSILDPEPEFNNLEKYGQVMTDVQTYVALLGIVSGTGYPQPKLLSEWGFLLTDSEDHKSKERGDVKCEEVVRKYL